MHNQGDKWRGNKKMKSPLVYKKTYFLILIFIYFTLLIQISSAITANSSSYSVIMFGTGMAVSNPSDGTYNSTALSEAKATTRNAESGTYTANIGFFENTVYHRTVSIVSYSISPRTVVVGSTISLSISALNYQSVWAKITAPNSQEQTLTLINGASVSYLPSPSIVGRYNVIFYTNSSTGAIASAVDYFDLTEQPTSTPQQSGGGGGTTIIIEKCTYIWDCTSWSLCSEEKQKRECRNIGTCNGTENKPIEERDCSDALFDVSIKLNNLVLTKNETLKFNVDLIEKLGIEKIDVHIKYSIIDKDNNEIFSQIETRAIQGSLSYQKEISEIKLTDGEYKLRVDIIYGNLQKAFAEQKFEVAGKKLESKYNALILFVLGIGILILLLIFIIIVILKRRRKVLIEQNLGTGLKLLAEGSITEARSVYENIKKIYNSREDSNREMYPKIIEFYNKILKSKPLIVFMGIIGVIVVSLSLFEPNITGRAIGIGEIKTTGGIFIFAAILVLVLLIILQKKIIEFLSSSCHKHQNNSIKGLIKKKVYSESGDYIGKIEEVIIGENRIDSFKIKLKRKTGKVVGIVIKWKSVKNIKDVMIIDKEVLGRIGDIRTPR